MARFIIAAMLAVAMSPSSAIAQVGTIGGAPTPFPLGMTSRSASARLRRWRPPESPLAQRRSFRKEPHQARRPLAFRKTTSRGVQASAARSRKPPSGPARLPPWKQAALLPRDWPPRLMAAPPGTASGTCTAGPNLAELAISSMHGHVGRTPSPPHVLDFQKGTGGFLITVHQSVHHANAALCGLMPIWTPISAADGESGPKGSCRKGHLHPARPPLPLPFGLGMETPILAKLDPGFAMAFTTAATETLASCARCRGFVAL